VTVGREVVTKVAWHCGEVRGHHDSPKASSKGQRHLQFGTLALKSIAAPDASSPDNRLV
jgi:hypothetical protein